MADVAISKTQKRVAAILNVKIGDTYESAKIALEAAGVEGSAIPQGKSWRDVAKMTDADLIAAIRVSSEDRMYRSGYKEDVDRY
jgi:hypothetical protein